MKSILAAVLAFGTLGSAASAADLAVQSVDLWSGYYVGVQGGGAWGTADSVSQGFETDEVDYEGGFGGIYYGRNWQFGQWVLGLDGSVSFGDIEGEFNFSPLFGLDTVEGHVEGFSASRARVGYAFDNVMVFGTAGFSLARLDAEYREEFSGVLDRDHIWLKGFTVGAGLETKFSENWSARVEYMYVDYRDDTIPFDAITEPSEIDLDLHVVRAGIAYHF